MNKAIRIASIVMLVILVVSALAMPALAVDPTTFHPENADGNVTGVQNLFESIIRIVQVVGTGIAIIMLIVLAIKYLMAAPSEKADIKKGALVYVVAAIILFAAVNILAAIQDWASDINIVTNGAG